MAEDVKKEPKKEVNSKSKTNSNSSKITVNKNRLVLVIVAVVVIVLAIVGIIMIFNKKDISKVSDYSSLSNRYADDLKAVYDTEESKNKFIDDYDFIQGAVGFYFMDNSTTEEASFETLISRVNEIFKSDNWEVLSIDKPTFWNGEFSVTDEGIVTFKFKTKAMEPSWINDEELQGKIELN